MTKDAYNAVRDAMAAGAKKAAELGNSTTCLEFAEAFKVFTDGQRDEQFTEAKQLPPASPHSPS